MKTTTILLLLIITLGSCNQTPECETNMTGTITINNNTNCPYSIIIYDGNVTQNNIYLSVNPNSSQSVDVSVKTWYVNYKCTLTNAAATTNYQVAECGEYSLQLP